MAVISGGTTLIDNGALDAAVPSGSLILLSTQTASASASIEFTSGIDSTYSSYVFKFINIHGSTEADNTLFQFQCSTDGGSNYNTTMTSTHFRAGHNENDADSFLSFNVTQAQAQETDFKTLSNGTIGIDNDQNASGMLQIFNPSSTTFVKHFINTTNSSNFNDVSMNTFNAGYFNTTSAINAIQFKFNTGNIDDGIIKMYGVK